VGKRLSLLDGFCNLLEFADGFVEQAHLAVGDSEIVVRLEIFVLVAHLTQLAAELLKDFGELIQAFGGDFRDRLLNYRRRGRWRGLRLRRRPRGRNRNRRWSYRLGRRDRLVVGGFRRCRWRVHTVDFGNELADEVFSGKRAGFLRVRRFGRQLEFEIPVTRCVRIGWRGRYRFFDQFDGGFDCRFGRGVLHGDRFRYRFRLGFRLGLGRLIDYESLCFHLLRFGFRLGFVRGNGLRRRFWLGSARNFLRHGSRRRLGHFLRHGFPFVREIHFLGRRDGFGLRRHMSSRRRGRRRFGRLFRFGRRQGNLELRGRRRYNGPRSCAHWRLDWNLDLGCGLDRNLGFRNRRRSRSGCNRRRRRRQILLRNTRHFLESLAQLGEAVCVDGVVALAVNLLKQRRRFCRATLVATPEVQVEQALESRSMARRALQNVLEKMRGLLRQPVTREEVHVRERLSHVALSFFVEFLFEDRQRRRRVRLRGWLRFDGGRGHRHKRLRNRLWCRRWGRHVNGLRLCRRTSAAGARAKLIEPLDKALVVLVPVDQFLKQFFGPRKVAGVGVRVRELAQRGAEAEWVAGVPAEIDAHLQAFRFARCALGSGGEGFQELILFPCLNYRAAEFAEQRQDVGHLSRFDHRVGDFVKLGKVGVSACELLSGAVDGLRRAA